MKCFVRPLLAGALAMAFWASACVPAAAADPSFGAKAGVSISTLTGDDVDGVSGHTGLVFGGWVAIELRPGWYLQPELLYAAKGADDHLAWVDEAADTRRYRLSYIEIPVLLKWKAFSTGSISPCLMLGPAIGLESGSRIEILPEGVRDEAIESRLDSVDFGLAIGVGAEIGHFILEVRYDKGLKSIFDEGDMDVKNAAIGFLAGITF